jgi:hypothetical protein
MVCRDVGSPCRNSSVTVSTVPVDGAHVMLIGVPAVTDVRVVNVKGFWAVVRAASVAIIIDAEIKKCILAVLLLLFTSITSQLLSRVKNKVYRSISCTEYQNQITETAADVDANEERAKQIKSRKRSKLRDARPFIQSHLASPLSITSPLWLSFSFSLAGTTTLAPIRRRLVRSPLFQWRLPSLFTNHAFHSCFPSSHIS